MFCQDDCEEEDEDESPRKKANISQSTKQTNATAVAPELLMHAKAKLLKRVARLFDPNRIRGLVEAPQVISQMNLFKRLESEKRNSISCWDEQCRLIEMKLLEKAMTTMPIMIINKTRNQNSQKANPIARSKVQTSPSQGHNKHSQNCVYLCSYKLASRMSDNLKLLDIWFMKAHVLYPVCMFFLALFAIQILYFKMIR
jgi:hypothetical protein